MGFREIVQRLFKPLSLRREKDLQLGQTRTAEALPENVAGRENEGPGPRGSSGPAEGRQGDAGVFRDVEPSAPGSVTAQGLSTAGKTLAGSGARYKKGAMESADALNDLDLQLIESMASGKEAQRVYFEPDAPEAQGERGYEIKATHARSDPSGESPVSEVLDGRDAAPRVPEAVLPVRADSAGLKPGQSGSLFSANELRSLDLRTNTKEAPVVGPKIAQLPLEFVWDVGDKDPEEAAQAEFEARLAAATVDEIDRFEGPEDEVPEELEELDDGLEEILGLATAGADTDETDWEEFALDADEFEEAPTREELSDIQAEGRLTRRQRAQQQAVALGVRFGWDEEGIAVLTDVFERWWWSAAKRSMERELTAGLEPRELRLAIEVREVWSNHPEFAMDFGRLMNHERDRYTSMVYRNLSWPLALQLVRTVDGYADAEYLDHLLCKHFDTWYTSSRLRHVYQAFATYLYFRLGLAEGQLDEWYNWTLEADPSLGLEDDQTFDPGYSTREHRRLAILGLLPQVPVPSVEMFGSVPEVPARDDEAAPEENKAKIGSRKLREDPKGRGMGRSHEALFAALASRER